MCVFYSTLLGLSSWPNTLSTILWPISWRIWVKYWRIWSGQCILWQEKWREREGERDRNIHIQFYWKMHIAKKFAIKSKVKLHKDMTTWVPYTLLSIQHTQINPLTAFTPVAGFGHEGIQREPRVSGNVKTRHSQRGKGLVRLIPTRALYSATTTMPINVQCTWVCVCVCTQKIISSCILSKGRLYIDII